MTEITERKMGLLLPAARKSAHVVDPVALIVGLIGGPLIVTAATFYAVIPVFALGMGGLLYLVAGFPAMLIWFARRPISSGGVATAAFLVNAGLSISVWAISLLFDAGDMAKIALFYLAFGSAFALTWGGVTGWIYVKLCNPIYQSSVLLKKGDH